MRSVSHSAWCISSIDSARVCPASSVNPQLSCIFECRKYWLIAVSSLVNCSLSSLRTSGSPCMGDQSSARVPDAVAAFLTKVNLTCFRWRVAEFVRHSVVLASDYRVPSVDEMWLSLKGRRDDFAGIGAHHVVVYASVWESGRVLVTIGVHNRDLLPELLRSPVIFEWFDVAGVDDIPAVFAGEVVEKLDLGGPVDGQPPGVVVAALASVEDVAALLDDVHSAAERFTAAGLRKVWIYRAID